MAYGEIYVKDDEYWFDADDGPIGPYDHKPDAESDRRGCIAFDRDIDKPGFLEDE